MKPLGEVLTASVQFLKQKGVGAARRVTEELIASVLKKKRLDLYMQFDLPLKEEELQQLRPLLKRAALGEPVDYILGEREFYQTQLTLTPAVLIPRPETEILVDLICKQLRQMPAAAVWDVCTGSGCIGIAIKKACPHCNVTLSDVSESALTMAAQNALKNGVEVECLQGDLLTPFAGRRADVVVCNPPYVSEREYAQLDPSVRAFEPRLALVGGEDGLEYYRRLKEKLPFYLQPGAQVFFEIGAGQGEALKNLFAAPPWKGVRVEPDWSGQDRFFFLEFDSGVL